MLFHASFVGSGPQVVTFLKNGPGVKNSWTMLG